MGIISRIRQLLSGSEDKPQEPQGGYWPHQSVVKAVEDGVIQSGRPIQPSQFQPVSLDLRLGPKAYRIQSSFLPENETVENKLKSLKLYDVDIDKSGILEKGAIYLVPLIEEMALPENAYAVTNPKSSTGRLDIFTRVIVDYGHRFDEVPAGYRGKLYLEIIPRSFPIQVRSGLSLNQIRFYEGDPYISKTEFKTLYEREPVLFTAEGDALLWDAVKYDEGLFVSVDLTGESHKNSIIAYKAKTNSEVIDLGKIGHYHPEDFWEAITPQKKGRLILEPESFYIMMSKEKICIWPDLLAEMIAYEPNSGELRTHYAGFFDSGFGWNGTDGVTEQGTHAVMEVRPHDVPFLVEDGQTFCRLKFEKTLRRPDKVYGLDIQSNYQQQSLKLSKHFKD